MFLKHITGFLICCWVLVFGVCGLLLLRAFRQVPNKSEVFACGNALTNQVKERTDSFFADGKAVFQSHCASCHNPIKDATGPALADISSFRSQEWICRFLTKPKFVPDDKRAIELRKNYGLSCMKFPHLNCKDVKAAVTFVDYHKR